MSNPLYEVGQTVYHRSSATSGFLDPIIISGVRSSGINWIYKINSTRTASQSLGTYSDKNSLITGDVLWFREDEFILYCEALTLAKQFLQKQLLSIDHALAAQCGETF
jgi:hypothetical protein